MEDATLRKGWSGGVSASVLSDMLGRSAWAVTWRAHGLGLERRRKHPKVRVDLLGAWSHELAYLLGFLYADGTVCKDRVVVTQAGDAGATHLRKIQAVFGGVFCGPYLKQGNARSTWMLTLCGRRVVDLLMGFGLRPNKAKVMSFPSVPPVFLTSFMCGLFDGDGSCTGYVRSYGYRSQVCATIISASRPFVEGLLAAVSSSGLGGCLVTSTKPNGRSYSVAAWSCRKARAFLRWVYGWDGEHIWCGRKYEKAVSLLVPWAEQDRDKLGSL